MASQRRVGQAVTGIDEILKGLDGLMELREPVSRAMGAAMGVEVRDEAIKRAPRLQPGNEGYDNQRAGQLEQAMYVAYDGRRSILNAGHFVYGVSWNARKAPHGHLLEFGHFMPFEAHTHAESGKWFTPIVGSRRVDGRKRQTGIPLVTPTHPDGFFVHAMPFLGPAFDHKLPTLAGVAYAAGKAAYTQALKG